MAWFFFPAFSRYYQGLQRLVSGARIRRLVRNADLMRLSNLSFLLVAGAWDNAGSWASLSAEDRASIKSQYAAAGIKLMVSAFGATDAPTSSGLDPVAIANTMGNWVKQYSLDGIDIDYEVRTSRLFPDRVRLIRTRSGFRSDGFWYVDPPLAWTIEPLTLGKGTAEAWLISFTRQLRAVLPSSSK